MEIAAEIGLTLPDWDTFIEGDVVDLPDPSPDQVFLAEFRSDPERFRLSTPSGKIELYSEQIASFGYDDCPGHAAWFEQRDLAEGRAERYPLYLLSGQPETRLHSQLDNGDFSKSKKIDGREPVLVHPDDAHDRGITHGDIVELFNARGRCLAGAHVTDEVARGAVFLWTGAWYDPDFDAEDDRDRHGNPNVLTHDRRTSRLTQGPAAHSTLVEIRRFDGAVPPITVHSAPQFVARG
jgi:biotin/methionine sulfoxide reductase